MKSKAPITHALIDAVHRRIFLLRVVESIALGCAAAAVAAKYDSGFFAERQPFLLSRLPILQPG